jgi:molybdopterin synthase catalytic subunit
MSDTVILSADPLDESALREQVGGEKYGAVVSFAGVVRRDEGDVALRAIDYEAYAPMAQRVLHELLAEAHRGRPHFEAAIAHRTGLVAVGEPSVVIAVAAAHREEAFGICRWLIDELKSRVPIWKREHLPREGPARA